MKQIKKLFIPAISNQDIDYSKISEISNKLPKDIAIVYSIQYVNQAKQIKGFLLKDKSNKHRIIKFMQVLGCSKINFPKDAQAILLIGSGRFHAISLSASLNKFLPIYILEKNILSEISKEEVSELKLKQKAAYVNFLNSKSIGILVSTKPGQENLKKALSMKNELEREGKFVYILIGDDLNMNKEIENFPDIQCWINTACPRLEMDYKDNKVINLSQLNSF